MIVKNWHVILMLALALCAVPAQAQNVRVLSGVTGSIDWDNYDFGLAARIEFPFLHRYEIDLQDAFAPVEQHVSLGHGRANLATAESIAWLSNSWGLSARLDDSAYDVTKVTKDADYAFGGAIYRHTIAGYPGRFTFSYIQQFNNGITPSGLESSHMKGAEIGIDVRMGCAGTICFRVSEDVNMGQVWTQGNPACDGSYGGAITCARGRAFGGGFQAAVLVEWPRPRGREYEPF